jgi:SET domain-containing protein 6
MIAIKPIRKGEQIFNDYGNLPRSDLLRRYGYVTDEYKKWDVVEVPLKYFVESVAELKGIKTENLDKQVS